MFKCIIIDDELWARKIIKNFATWDALHIELVGEGENGQQALSLIEDLKPDIVITDMDMGTMNGVELLKQVSRQYSHIKVIVISGYDDFTYMKQAIRSNAVEYILKPIDAQELNGALTRCIDRIVQDKQLRIATFYDIAEEGVVKALLSKIARFKESIQGVEQEQVLHHIQEIREELIKFREQEKLLIALLNDYILPQMREGLMDVIKRDETISNRYKDFRYQSEQQMDLNTYFETMKALAIAGIQSRIQWSKESERTVAELAKDYIDEVYRANIHLSEVARRFFVSKEYMSQTFKQTYGVTIGNYILSKKMEEALRLIEAGEKYHTIAEILHYSDVNYFYKVFKKYYHKTPGEFQK